MADDTSNLLNGLVNLGTPFAKSFLYGKPTASEADLQAERNQYNQLNGSGPNSPAYSTQGPDGMTDFLFGSPDMRAQNAQFGFGYAAPAPGVAGFSYTELVMVAAVGVGVFFLLKHI